MRMLAYWWGIVRGAAVEFARDNLVTHAAAISFFAILSVFPALLGTIALFSAFVDRAEIERAILRPLYQYLPPQSFNLLTANVLAVAESRGELGAAATAALLWAAGAVGGAVRNALNAVLDAGRPHHWLLRKTIEIGMVFLGGVALMLSVSTAAATRILSGAGEGWVEQAATWIARVVELGVPYVAVALGFFLLYLLVPTLRLPARSLALGAAVAALLFEAAKAGFFLYLRSIAPYQVVYGSVAGVIVFLVWVYLSAAIMLFGAELAARHADASGLRRQARVQD